MVIFDSTFQILVGIDPIDFRAGLNKLASIAQAQFAKNPRERFIFVFRNKRKTDIKLIGYDGNGFFMGHKRLSKGKLKWWPRTEGESLSIDSEQLVRLLKGVDPRGRYHPDWFRKEDHGEQGQAHFDPIGSGHGRSQNAYPEE